MTQQTFASPWPSRPEPETPGAGWLAWLRQHVQPDWRPGEWDHERMFFDGDLDNDATGASRCKVVACQTPCPGRVGRCSPCAVAARSSDLPDDEFDATYQPTRKRRVRGISDREACLVADSSGRCARESVSHGLCPTHASTFSERRRRSPELSVADWQLAAQPQPLAHQGECRVGGCVREQQQLRLCGSHHGKWRRELSSGRHGPDQLLEWAAATGPFLQAHQFWCGGLHPVVAHELLFGLQERDRAGLSISPLAVRLAIAAVAGVDSLCGLDVSALRFGREKGSSPARALLGQIQRMVERARRQCEGADPMAGEVWDAAAVGLWAATHRRYDAVKGDIDFRVVRQQWLRTVLLEWARSVRPTIQDLRTSLLAFSAASEGLSQRAAGGDAPSRLGAADMTAAVDAIKKSRKKDGKPRASATQDKLVRAWFAVLEVARASGLMDDVPGAFSRARHHRVAPVEVNEEHVGRALPDSVVRQLDAQLHLLDVSHRGWPRGLSQLFHQTVYAVLRDTGRRLGEVASLKVDCVEQEDEHYQLVYDNHKAKRNGRRLPIAQSTAELITRWEQRRAELPLTERAGQWLFPSAMHGSGRGNGHIRGDSISAVLRTWVDSLPRIDGDMPGPDGQPLPFDRSQITAHAFRHTYAQRHADAGVPVDVLRDLMDHTSVDTTMGYYQVTLKRKREAVRALAPLAVDRTGRPAPLAHSKYEIASVAVPFGNCTEPSNVKAGGGSCPLRFQCSGCPFYRPDPSYLPAIEDHVRDLKADREAADAVGAADFVLTNINAEIASYQDVTATMRDQLAVLPDDERLEIEEASKILRKSRATASHKLLPLTAINPREEDQ
ncbi:MULTISPECIES: site-specific integrase [Streptomyces]|uniref:tyrosine-type recombinase/integrase n=1 Tax=Streptomyces TaxID=1883 RepID=UPI00056BF371|nr:MULTISPECIES: site-specific integrase [Streptomyces]RWZ77616.1 site-specific integrase [Streptomyces albidoflavus]